MSWGCALATFSHRKLLLVFFLFFIFALITTALPLITPTVSAQKDDWQIGDIVGLPKGKLIRVGSGFEYPAHTCVPEDNWLVKVIGGPRNADGQVWYAVDRHALDGLPTSGTGWVVRAETVDVIECPSDDPGGDKEPPIISNVQVWHDGNGNVLISATVTDNVAVAAVRLLTNIGEFMMLNGGGDDYTVTLNGLGGGTTLEFRIHAVDTSFNNAFWPSSGVNQVKINRTGQAGFLPWITQVAEPVSLPLGNFATRHSDVVVPGIGIPFEFARTYNVTTPFDSPLGFGWTHSYRFRLEHIDNALFRGMLVTYPDGHTAKYTENSGNFAAPPGHFDTLITDGSDFLLTTPEQLIYRFDSQGRLTRLQDRHNNALTFSYNGDNLTSIVDTVGRTFSLTYNDQGHIATLVDPLGRVVEYIYDGAGNLISVNLPGKGYLQYSYDNSHRLLTITDPNDHTFVTNTYDGRDRVVEQRDAAGSVTRFTYADDDSQAVMTDNEGHATTYRFDDEFRLIEETDALGFTAHYGYDTNHNRILVADKTSHETHYSYDQWGNVVAIIDALGGQTTLQFVNGRDLIYMRDTNGAEIIIAYDANGNPASVTTALGTTLYHYDGRGLVVDMLDPDENQTTFAYDPAGNLIITTDAQGHITNFDFDEIGRLLHVTDANLHTSSFVYNQADQLVQTIDPVGKSTFFKYDAIGNLLVITDRMGAAISFVYDVNDQLITVTDPLLYTARFSYDRMYHLTSTTDRRGNTTSLEYDAVYNLIRVHDPSAAITNYEYDPNGEVVAIIDALGHRTTFTRDPLHRITRIVDALNQITDISYDAIGQPVTVRDARGGVTTYTYNPLGQVISITDALTNTTHFNYDARGNLVEVVDALSHHTRYEYNSLNQLVSIVDALNHQQRIRYDAVGNITRMVDKRGFATTFRFDENDNLIRVRDAEHGVTRYDYDPEGRLISTTNPNGNTTRYTYDLRGDLITEQLPQGQITQLAYDANQNLASIANAKGNATTYSYGPRDLLETVVDPLSHITAYSYDALKRLVLMTDAEDRQTKYDYDALGQLIAVTQNYTGGQVNNLAFPDQDVQTSYTYDPLGALLSITDANNHTQSFTVDLLGRVVCEQNALNHEWQYGYDAVGNLSERTDANGDTIRYAYDALNRLTRTAYDDGSRARFHYDNNDNLVRMVDDSGRTVMHYDGLNQLVRLSRTDEHGSSQTFRRVFDAAGNLTGIGYPDGKTVHFSYNRNEWLKATLDPRAGRTTYDLDPNGLVTAVHYPNHTTTRRMYDAADRLISLVTRGRDGVYAGYAYTLDAVGNRVQTVETLQGASWKSVETEEITTTPPPTMVLPAALRIVESDEQPTVTQEGNWRSQNASRASGGSYLYSSESDSDILTLKCEGTRLEVQYVEHSTFGTLAIEVDQTVLRTVNTANDETVFGATAVIDYLDNKSHVVRLYASEGVIAIDALYCKIRPPQINNWLSQPLTPDHHSHTPKRTINYDFDALYRLTEARYSTGQFFEYTYDLVGNILSERTNWNTRSSGRHRPPPVNFRQFSYDAANELLTAGDLRFSYDLNGNRTRMKGPDETVNYEYDGENRLVEARVYDPRPGHHDRHNNPVPTSKLYFEYDGLGHRTKQSEVERNGRDTTRYLYADFGYEPLAERNRQGQTSYYTIDPLGQRISISETHGHHSSDTSFFHPDGIGSVSAITSEHGRLVDTYSYAPFGMLEENNSHHNDNHSDSDNAITFNNVEWQDELGGYLFGARVYDPTTMNWLTQDLYRGATTDPSSLQRYSFVDDNPTNLADFGGFFDVTTGRVQAGDSLWSISQQVFGDGRRWTEIYDANRSQISNPNILSPGMIFKPSHGAASWGEIARGQVVAQSVSHNPMMKSGNGGTYNSSNSLNTAGQQASLSFSCPNPPSWLVIECKSDEINVLNGTDILLAELQKVDKKFDETSSWLGHQSVIFNYAMLVIGEADEKRAEIEEALCGANTSCKTRIWIRIGTKEQANNIETNGIGNVVFGYLMAKAGYNQWTENRISDVFQSIRDTALRFDKPDDRLQREVGRVLFLTSKQSKSGLTKELIEQIAESMGLYGVYE